MQLHILNRGEHDQSHLAFFHIDNRLLLVLRVRCTAKGRFSKGYHLTEADAEAWCSLKVVKVGSNSETVCLKLGFVSLFLVPASIEIVIREAEK